MASGETLLKLTDYPFAYSFVAIFSGMIGFSLGQNQLIFLGIAGAVGTFLTIIDPLGELFRKNAERLIKNKNKKLKLDNMDLQFKLSSLKTKSITYEMEKIIGMFYFVIILILFSFAVILPTPFFDKLVILDSDNEPLCSEWCFKLSYLGIALVALVILSSKGKQFWKELYNKIDIAAYHMTVINDDNATPPSVESLTRAVEQNDWELADLWSEKIAEEIQYKKGKRELIIKAADMVFSLLHKEATGFENQLKTIPHTRRYPSFDHPEWDKIKQHSHQSIIEDTKLRHRIDSFYNIMYDYNGLLGNVARKVDEIIVKYTSLSYGSSVVNIIYDVKSDKGNGKVDLIGCAIFNIHPLNFYGDEGTVRGITVRINRNNTHSDSHYIDSTAFDNAWKKIIPEVTQNLDVQKLKKLFSMLTTENPKLMTVYSEKIGMQWKV